jgi:serine/threonine-protein kinase
MELKPGQIIDGKYRIDSLLGEGGMGAVWKATDTQLDRVVALKVLHTDLRSDPSLNSRFQREARLVASLEHPGIVPIYAWLTIKDEQGGEFPGIVMPFVKGEPLAEYLHQHGKLAVPEAVKLTTSLLDALSVAHEAGIIHRDLKPANVMLENHRGELHVRLLDFGIAKSIAADPRAASAPAATQAGMLLGTPAYMSPEQINNPAKVDGRADLWAVSVCFYEMLTAQLPFPGNSPIETISRVLTAPPQAACRVNPQLPPAVDGVFAELFNRDLEKRPRDARAMAALLSTLAAPAGQFNVSPGGGPGMQGPGTPPPGYYPGAPMPPQPMQPYAGGPATSPPLASYPGAPGPYSMGGAPMPQPPSYPGGPMTPAPQPYLGAQHPGPPPAYGGGGGPAAPVQGYPPPTMGAPMPGVMPSQPQPWNAAPPGMYQPSPPSMAQGQGFGAGPMGPPQPGFGAAPGGLQTGFGSAPIGQAPQVGAKPAVSGGKFAVFAGLSVGAIVTIVGLSVIGVIFLLVSMARGC